MARFFAQAILDADALAPAFLLNDGFVDPPVRTGPGVYELTFNQQIDPNECTVQVTPREATVAGGGGVGVVATDDKITISTALGGAFADVDVAINVFSRL